MGGAKNCPETPRQKMISMMYLVLTAMLALNVSAQILNGYSLVNESMQKSIKISDGKLANLNGEFGSLLHSDSIKANLMKPKVDSVIAQSDEFCDYITGLENRIITTIMGDPNATELDESMNGDLNVASQIGLVEKVDGKTNGKILAEKMAAYREFMAGIDTSKAESIRNTFATDELRSKDGDKRSWENGVFEDMPAIATLAVLNKIKNDVKMTEAEGLAYLIGAMDAGDFRVNKIQALAIPNSSYIMRGNKYSAHIILAATDSTKEPEIVIGGSTLPAGKDRYEFACNTVGNHKYSGKMILTKKDGEKIEYPFTSEYTVGEPTATVSADLMNVLYAGFDNPISVSVPGCSQSDISINVTNSKNHSKTAKGWSIKPATVGTPCIISVNAVVDGKSTFIAKKEFRVKKLPDPLAMLEVTKENGTKDVYDGKKAISKKLLLTARRLVARLPDADLDVKYRVLDFCLYYTDSMGNTIVEKSNSDQLTDRQAEVFKKMVKGKNVFVTNTNCIGQDNVKRILPVMEVKIQ